LSSDDCYGFRDDIVLCSKAPEREPFLAEILALSDQSCNSSTATAAARAKCERARLIRRYVPKHSARARVHAWVARVIIGAMRLGVTRAWMRRGSASRAISRTA
jgi:hypothetical protein